MLIGTTLLYVLSDSDATAINRRRTSTESIRSRLKRNPPEWPTGTQAHIGEPVTVGQVVPFIVTWASEDEERVSGQAVLNGNDTLWVTAVWVVRDRPPKPGEAVAITDAVTFEATGRLTLPR